MMNRSLLLVAVLVAVALIAVGCVTPGGTATPTPSYESFLHCDRIEVDAGSMNCVHTNNPTWEKLQLVQGNFTEILESDYFVVTRQETIVTRIVRKNDSEHRTEVIFQR